MNLHDIAPRIARARDQYLEERARIERERRHLADERLRLERLVAHRELEFLRAGAYRTGHRQHVKERSKKLLDSQRWLAHVVARQEALS